MAKTSAESLTFGPEPYLATCQRCGQTVDKPPLPASMDAFIQYLRDASKTHSACKERAQKVEASS